MSGLLFNLSELEREAVALQTLSNGFLDNSSYPFEEIIRDIRGIHGTHNFDLKIPRERPLRTLISEGEFEPKNKSSGCNVFATISGKWELQAEKNKGKSCVKFIGLASGVITVYDEATLDPLAHWKMELGDARSPGCYFHTYSPLKNKSDLAFGAPQSRDSFPIPRHPNIFPTPMAIIGFTLGELFQEKWAQAVSGGKGTMWRSIQRKRLTQLLNWQIKVSNDTSFGPWISLKNAKPPANLFL